MIVSRFFSILTLSTLLGSLLLVGCLRTKGGVEDANGLPEITLDFYGLFDNESIYAPFIEAYETTHPNVTILYKKFTDPGSYLDLIVNELAEGEGPDVFMMENTWFPKHYKKLTPAPSDFVTPELFRAHFVEVTADDLIIPDGEGQEQVWGIPLYVDSLALYYNDAHFEDALPSQGKPSRNWEGIKNDVTLLNRQDQSFERFERAGIALGRSDNILRAFDALLLMMMQNKTVFYSPDLKEAIFGGDAGAIQALTLYTSFGLPSQRNYSWNKYLADADSGEKEITTFARGKLSMLLGYSYTYADILNEIQRLKSLGETTIDASSVKIQEIPQTFDPASSSETRMTYAQYFVPVVSRTSQHAAVAWDFLASMTDPAALRLYNEATHRPAALRTLITEEMKDPIYGVFAGQVGYAHSVPVADIEAYEIAFLSAVDQVLGTASVENVLRNLEEIIQNLIPSSGVRPLYTPEAALHGSFIE